MSRTTPFGFAAALSALALATACGGGHHAATTSTNASSSVAAMGARPEVTKGAIRQLWETFFDGSTSTTTRISLLQNGQQFSKTIAAIDASPLAKQVKAQVASVQLDGPTTATVTFTVLLGTTPLLQGIKGSAVLVNGTWKVGVTSFCQFAALEGTTLKACSKAGK